MVFVGLKSDFRGYWLRQISQCITKVSDARTFNPVVLCKTIRKCSGYLVTLVLSANELVSYINAVLKNLYIYQNFEFNSSCEKNNSLTIYVNLEINL